MVSLLRPASGQYAVLYADQVVDSVMFATFDSYRTFTNEAWITIDSKWASQSITNSYWGYWQVAVPLTFTPNTTGETRLGQVAVNSYGDDNWNQTVTAAFLQLGWLNVVRPAAVYPTYTDYPRKASFTQKDSATQVTDSLMFCVYDDWTLTTDASYIHLAITSGSKGSHTVRYTLDANDASEDREASVNLVCNGVTQPIRIQQKGRKQI